jgi:hypothetical protein
MPTYFPIVPLRSTLERAGFDFNTYTAKRATEPAHGRDLRTGTSRNSSTTVDSYGHTRASKRKPLAEPTPAVEMGPLATKKRRTVAFIGLPQARADTFQRYIHAERELAGEEEM